MNYGELKILVSNHFKRVDLVETYDGIRDLTEELIAKTAKLLIMETATTDLAGTWADSIALPADFAQFKSVRSAVRALDVYTMDQLILMAKGGDSSPFGYTLDAGQLIIRNGNADIFTTYYARPSGLTSDSSTNKVLTAAPTLYLYGMLGYLAKDIQDDNLTAGYQAQYGAELGFLNELDANARMSGSAPQIKGA